MRINYFLFVILLIFSPYLTIDEASAQDSIQIPEVIVSATRIPVVQYESGRSVEVVRAEQINNMPVNSVDELLRYVNGVNLNTRGAFGVQADIGMRGSTFSQVLVLIDDVRFNDPLTAHFNSNFPVALADIDRIEIVRGPTTASFGSDAVGGMIHIKTKTFAKRMAKDKFGLTGSVNVGEHRLQQTDLGAFYQKKNWQLSASMKSTLSDGEEVVNPNFLQGVATDSLADQSFDVRTYSISAANQINNHLRVAARLSYDDRDFAAQYYYTRSTFDESRETIKNIWTQASLWYDKNGHATSLHVGYKKTDDQFVFNPLFSANEHDSRQTFVHVSHRLKETKRSKIAFGAQFVNKTIESTDRGDHDNNAVGAYAVHQFDVSNRVHINSSLRLEYDQNFEFEVLPQLSVSYRKGIYVVRSSYGRSIRAADFTERYISSQLNNLSPGRNAGNPDLKAEVSNSVDLGIDIYSNIAQFGITTFFRSSNNLIDYALRNSNDISNLNNLQPNEDYFYADNIAKSEVIGLEANLEKKIELSTSTLMNIKLAYQYLSTTAEAGKLSKYIANHPTSNVSAVINLSLGKFDIISASNYISRSSDLEEAILGDVPSQYFTSNLRLMYGLGKHIKLHGNVHNITDETYQEILGARLPGRWFSGGISWQL